MNKLGLNTNLDIFIDNECFAKYTGEDTETYKKSIAHEIFFMLKTKQGEAFTNYSYDIL